MCIKITLWMMDDHLRMISTAFGGFYDINANIHT